MRELCTYSGRPKHTRTYFAQSIAGYEISGEKNILGRQEGGKKQSDLKDAGKVKRFLFLLFTNGSKTMHVTIK